MRRMKPLILVFFKLVLINTRSFEFLVALAALSARPLLVIFI